MANNNFVDAVGVPAAQALLTGTLSGVAAAAGCSMLKIDDSLSIGFLIGSGAALGAWLDYRYQWQHILERMLNVDLNRDGYIGEPQPVAYAEPEHYAPIRVEVVDDPNHVRYIDLPAKPEQLRMLADGLNTGRQFAQSAWTGNGAPFTRQEFETLRAELLRRNLATWRKEGAPAQGVELNAAGRAVFKHFATPHPTGGA